MTYDQAMAYWFGRVNYEIKAPHPSDLGLDRMRALLARLGNPQDRFRIVHVAGTKGKGSTAAMLASILRQAGYRTGLFTSPHLVRVEERIVIDDVPIATEELAGLMADIQAAAVGAGSENLDSRLTFFEIATALGFLHFARREVDIAVVEVGLGGRFDSTNVCRPLLAIITSISLDHTQQLGNTLASIAREKGGIIKPGRPTLSGVMAPEARTVIEELCRQRGSPLIQLGRDVHYRHEPALTANGEERPPRVQITTPWQTWPWLETKLIGEHQAGNAALAVAAAEMLRAQGMALANGPVAEGLAQVCWPARMEIMGRRPLVVLDCAHNVASAEALAQALAVSMPRRQGGRRLLVFAGSRDKDLAGMLAALAPGFDRFFLTRYASSVRAAAPEELLAALPAGRRRDAELHPAANEAWNAARSSAGPQDLICVTGSVFLAGELRPLLV